VLLSYLYSFQQYTGTCIKNNHIAAFPSQDVARDEGLKGESENATAKMIRQKGKETNVGTKNWY
jgi:hypothetical protein